MGVLFPTAAFAWLMHLFTSFFMFSLDFKALYLAVVPALDETAEAASFMLFLRFLMAASAFPATVSYFAAA